MLMGAYVESYLEDPFMFPGSCLCDKPAVLSQCDKCPVFSPANGDIPDHGPWGDLQNQVETGEPRPGPYSGEYATR